MPVVIYKPGWSEALWESSVFPKNKMKWHPGQGSNPDHNTLGHCTSYARSEHIHYELTLKKKLKKKTKQAERGHVKKKVTMRESKTTIKI